MRFQKVFIFSGVRIVAINTRLFGISVGFDGDDLLFLVTVETELSPFLDEQLGFDRLMRGVAGSAFAVASRGVLEWGFGNVLLKIIMALVTKLPIGFNEQFLDVRLMWFVAGRAFAIFHRLMLHFAGQQLLLRVVVAFEAKFAVGFDQQALEVRGMWIMAGGTFAVFYGLMLRFRSLGEGVMALQAERLAGLNQHFGIRRAVRIVTGRAFAIFDRLMFDFCFLEKIFVTSETDLLLRPLQFDRKTRLMTFVALLVFIRRMRNKFDFGHNRGVGLNADDSVQRLSILVVNDR